MTPEQASDFYAEHFGKFAFTSLVAYMSSGPIIALVISRDQAISYWKELIGPTNSLKAKQTHPDWYVCNSITVKLVTSLWCLVIQNLVRWNLK